MTARYTNMVKGYPKIPHTLWVGIGVFLVLLSVSCRTLSPLTTPPETIHTKFATPEDILPQWQPFAASLSPGLAYFEGTIQKPKLRFWALRVDLTEPALRIVVSEKEGPPSEDGTIDGVIPSTKITSFVRRYDCLAGINTNPFSPVSGKEGEDRTIVGITVSQGTIVALPHPSFDGLVFYDDGKAAIVNQAALTEEQFRTIRNAVGGFYAVLRDGAVLEGAFTRGNVRHPRSGVGVSADGGILYLLVIDGRQLGSIGATEAEVGLILQKLGALDGLNLDGGGSTALALRFPDGKVRAVNTPIHKLIPGRERGVATCLGIALNHE
ncbi:MAG: phosphodiester glycosidase family protein [Treponema sp.]|nr:phosphodiester glycosidase family protein [Treponema sp.]